ncbi:MAG: HPr family phosphocarrier protein [Thiohalomonadales bacterium]
MINYNITIINKLGLHARAAAKFVTIASKFESTIDIECKKNKVNGKSIMGVMMLAASKGTDIELIISGIDEEQAFKALSTLINNRFDEKE